jgi:DHA3 family macrolide efflux protein-like MFS transporter
LLEAIFGGGVVAGGVLLSAWGGFKRKILTTMAGLMVLAVGFLILGIVPATTFWLALAAALGMGISIPLIDGPIMAIMQGTVAPEMQGRVFTLMGSLIWLTSPFSLAVAGPVSDWLGLQVWYLIAGLLCLATGLAGLFIPAVLSIEENGNGQVEAPESLVEIPVEA